MPKQVLVVWSIFLEFSFFFFHDCSIVGILRILALLPSHLWKFSIVLKTKVNGYERCYDILSFFNGYWFCPKSNFEFRPFKCIMKSWSLGRATHFGLWLGMPKGQARLVWPNIVASWVNTTQRSKSC